MKKLSVALCAVGVIILLVLMCKPIYGRRGTYWRRRSSGQGVERMYGSPANRKKAYNVQRAEGASSYEIEPGGERGEIKGSERWSLDNYRDPRRGSSSTKAPTISFEEFQKQNPDQVRMPDEDEFGNVSLEYPSDGMSAAGPEIQIDNE